MSPVNTFSLVPYMPPGMKRNRRDGACRTCQKRSFKPKAACHRYTSVRLLKTAWASPRIPPPASGCQELPQKLFHVLRGSLLSISHFTCLNGRDHSAQVCLCSSSVLIRPRRWDAVDGTSPLQGSEPAAHAGAGGAGHRNPCHGWLVTATLPGSKSWQISSTSRPDKCNAKIKNQLWFCF